MRVYDESGGTWTQVGADIDGDAAGDNFGRSVSLSSNGKLLVISAPGLYTRVYFESGGTWTQLGLDIDGRSVSISSDGGRVATGDFLNDRVRVYSIPNPNPVIVGGDTVTATPGTYRVTYSVTDSNTGRSGFRSRVVIVT